MAFESPGQARAIDVPWPVVLAQFGGQHHTAPGLLGQPGTNHLGKQKEAEWGAFGGWVGARGLVSRLLRKNIALFWTILTIVSKIQILHSYYVLH